MADLKCLSMLHMANTLSIIAIVISLFTLFIEFYRDLKINKTNLKSEYFKQLYFEILLEKIPKSRNDLVFGNNGFLLNYDSFIGLFFMILDKSMYYKYTDSKYYYNLKESIESLEDYVFEAANVSFSAELRQSVLSDIDERVENIFSVLTDKYEKG